MVEKPSLAAEVEGYIREAKLLKPAAGIVVAVSGGLDSLLLLHVLRDLAPLWRWRLHVGHFNHQLRGRAGDEDERRVRRVAARMAIPCTVGRGDVGAVARAGRVSVEMAGRDMRHRFLAGLARQAGCRAIALAHHANDQVELFLLRLLRGAGLEGLLGMKPGSPSPADSAIRLVRPFLAVPRGRLEEEARRRRLRWGDDESNRSLDPLRNRVRNELLPWLTRHMQPAVTDVLLRTMELLRGEAELAGWAAIQPRFTGRGRLRFSLLPVAIQRRTIRQGLWALGVRADFALVERLRAHSQVPQTIDGDRWVQRCSDGRVVISRREGVRFGEARLRVTLDEPKGRLEWGGVEFCWQIRPRKRGWDWRRGRRSGREVFDADRVGSAIVLRHWGAGDRFEPLGLGRPAKLQDLFTAAKVPAEARRTRVIAEREVGGIFWVEGLRIGEGCQTSSSTRRTLTWEWRRVVNARLRLTEPGDTLSQILD
jgi:tRNA(Ile)-lysidine synthase